MHLRVTREEEMEGWATKIRAPSTFRMLSPKLMGVVMTPQEG